MTCKDCYHYAACQSQVPMTYWDSETFYKDCKHFKDKTKIFETPNIEQGRKGLSEND